MTDVINPPHTMEIPDIEPELLVADFGAPVEVISDELHEGELSLHEAYRFEEPGRMRRMGRFIANLPGDMKENAEYAAGALYDNPVGFLKENVRAAKHPAQLAVIGAELSPANELLRYGTLAYALANSSGGWAVGAVALGLPTLIVEGGAALATASIITTESASKIIGKVNKKVEEILPNNPKMTPPVEIGAALLGGSAVVMAEKQREDPARTTQQSRRHGMFTAGWMSAYFTAERAYIGANSEGTGVLNAKTIGAFFLSLGVTWAGTKIAMRRMKPSQEEAAETEA